MMRIMDMKYEYLCTSCNKLTEVNCSIKVTTPEITCECGHTALKNFSAQIGSNTRAEYFENFFFDLVPSQRANNTFHIPSDKLQTHRNGSIKKV
jgi:transcription elongation factor Elf1